LANGEVEDGDRPRILLRPLSGDKAWISRSPGEAGRAAKT